jgi:hypothetical protein
VLTIPANQDGGPPGGGGPGGATIDGEGASSPVGGRVVIKRKKDGDDEFKAISEENNNVLPGEFIELQCSLEDGPVLSNRWSIQGSIVRNWTANNSKSTLTKVTDDQLKDMIIQYVWYKSGTFEITCAVGDKIGWARFDVKEVMFSKLTSDLPGPIKVTNKYLKEGTYLAFGGQQPDFKAGFYAQVAVDVPAGFPAGQWEAVQLIKSDRSRTNVDKTIQNIRSNKFVLDTSYPYSESESTNKGGAFSIIDDSPAQLLKDEHRYSINSETFKTYILFKPAGMHSVFVPLKATDLWWWRAVAVNADGLWTLSPNSDAKSAIPQWNNADDYPMWTSNVLDIDWK